MIKLQINKQPYNLKEWSDLTLKECDNILSLEMPECFKEHLEAILNDKDYDFTSGQLYKELPTYYGKVIKLMTDIPQNVLNNVQWDERTNFFETYCKRYILDLHSLTPNFEPKGIKEFTIKGETYLLPESIKVLDRLIPGNNETALSFTEGSDMIASIVSLKETSIKGFAVFTAIFCRKKGEQYDEAVALERSLVFENLTMDVIWEVFFCIKTLLSTSKRTFITTMAKHQQGQKHQRAGVLMPNEKAD